MSQNNILIVEDDTKLRTELEIFLNMNGYVAKSLVDFDHPVADILSTNCQLILLDINLPMVDGQYVCKEIRKTSDVPIIMITSKNTELDELMSINYGADDFVTKPFNTQILLARINAILKRQVINQKTSDRLDLGAFVLDVSKSIVSTESSAAELTKNELKIMSYLSQHKGRIVSRDDIITYLWDSEMFVDDNTLTVNIARLRTKLEEELQVTNVILTKRGLGYMLI